METLFKYLKQPSTWQGLAAVVAAFGVALSPEQTSAIVTAAVGIVGAIHVFMDEDKKNK